MAGYKETPRQKMIAMMYLVLTALLALNVSKEMLNAFIVVNESVELTNKNFTKKLDDTYRAFDRKLQTDQVKVKPFWDKAQEARRISAEMADYVNNIKYELISQTDKISIDSAKLVNITQIKNRDDYSTPTNYFMRDSDDGSKGVGIELKNKIDAYRLAMLELLPDDDRDRVKIGLKTDGNYADADGKKLNWIQYNFYHTILAADLPILNKINTEVYNAEFDVVNFLLDAVDAKDFKYDQIDAKLLPKNNYVFVGEEYQAEVIVAAYSTTQNPEVFLKMGVDSLPLSQLSSATEIKGQNGKVEFKLPANSEGTQKYAGVIRVKGGTGEMNPYYFNDEYTVAKPSLTVSATKMNVFYLGVDNPVDISAPGIASEKLTANINFGTLKRSAENGNWIVKVDKAPQGSNIATITVTAEIDGQTKKMGETKFRLKRVPDPTAKIANQTEGKIDRNVLLYSPTIVPQMPKDFDFDLRFEIVSFKMVLQKGETPFEEDSRSASFTEKMKGMIKDAKRGQRIWFERIIARGPDGEERILNSIAFVID